MLNKDFKEFVGLLNSTGVEYLLVGGYALAAHGRPRYTGDLDIWVGHTRRMADLFGADLNSALPALNTSFLEGNPLLSLMRMLLAAQFAREFVIAY